MSNLPTEPTLKETEFQDKTGKVWDLEITLDAAQRIDSSNFTAVYDKPVCILDPDLFGGDDAESGGYQLISDALTKTEFCAALAYSIVSGDINQVEFCKRLNGPAIRDMKKALWGAFADFFPDQKTILMTIFKQYERVQERANQRVKELLPDVEKEFERVTGKLLDNMTTQATKGVKKELSRLAN